jgi:hypothetical protein
LIDQCELIFFSSFLIVATLQDYPDEYKPDWGLMSFLVDILRPSTGEGPSWYHLLRKSSGGCNDLIYSGHMFVAVLTAMAWAVCDVFFFSTLYCSCHVFKLPFQCHALLLQLKSALTGQSHPILDMLRHGQNKIDSNLMCSAMSYMLRDNYCSINHYIYNSLPQKQTYRVV